VRGIYVPQVVLQHLIPTDRLNKAYFRRWFYWRGISRAMMYAETGRDMENPETSTLDFSAVPHVLRVPRYMFRTGVDAAAQALATALRGNRVASFEHELWLWFFAGVLRQRWNDYVTSGQPHHPHVQPGRAAR
jgi:hypothetical protein